MKELIITGFLVGEAAFSFALAGGNALWVAGNCAIGFVCIALMIHRSIRAIVSYERYETEFTKRRNDLHARELAFISKESRERPPERK